MTKQGATFQSCISVIGFAVSILFPCVAIGQAEPKNKTFPIVAPPFCINDLGETVHFIESSRGGAKIAAGMAIRDRSGNPVVIRSNFSATPPEFQSFIDRHECAHHQTGDVDRPHPPRNSAKHLMNESVSDCIAILRLRDEEDYDRKAFDSVVSAMRSDMETIGFPEISISSRISNIDNCYQKSGSPQDFIRRVVDKRARAKPQHN